MKFIEDPSVGLFAEAEGATFFEGFLPSSEAGTDHEVIAEPLEWQSGILLFVLVDLPHTVFFDIYQHIFTVYLEVLRVR